MLLVSADRGATKEKQKIVKIEMYFFTDHLSVKRLGITKKQFIGNGFHGNRSFVIDSRDLLGVSRKGEGLDGLKNL